MWNLWDSPVLCNIVPCNSVVQLLMDAVLLWTTCDSCYCWEEISRETQDLRVRYWPICRFQCNSCRNTFKYFRSTLLFHDLLVLHCTGRSKEPQSVLIALAFTWVTAMCTSYESANLEFIYNFNNYMIFLVHCLAQLLNSGDHLHILVNELNNIRSRWYDIGVQLRIPVGDLDSIRIELAAHGNAAQLRGLLIEWFKGQGIATTWENLIQALCSAAMNESELALHVHLQAKFCPSAEGE